MRQLTEAESNLINTSDYSVDYNEEFDAARELDIHVDISDKLEMRFDNSVKYDAVEDYGGINVYFKDNRMIAFYDYEQLVGTYFPKNTK